MQSENKLGVMPISKLIWNMSLPIIASMLVQALYNIVDSWFVSRVSEQALTAVSLAFPAQNLMIGLATGTAVGVNALMGRALGAGLRERADKVFAAVFAFAREYCGPKPNRKFYYFKPAHFCGEEVPELVHKNRAAEKQQNEYYRPRV